MFQGILKSVSRKFKECFKEVSRVFKGSFRGCFKKVSRVFQVLFRAFHVVLRLFQVYSKEF